MPKTFRQNMGFIGALLDEYQKAIEEYNRWIETEAISMTMKLNEVRGKI